MKTLVRCCWVALLGLLITMSPLSTAVAQDKAVAIVSIAPLSKVFTDIQYVSSAAGQPGMGGFVVGIAGGATSGLDKSRPTGVVLMSNGQDFTPLVFLPLSDLDALLDAVKLAGVVEQEIVEEDAAEEDAEAEPDAVRMLQVPVPGLGAIPVFFKVNNGWLFLGRDKEKLTNLPDDPAALLGDLPKNYDFAIQGNLQNVPELYREIILQQVVSGAEGALLQEPGESDDEFAKRKGMVQLQLKQLERLFNEFVDMTLGFNINPDTKETYLDITYSVVPGSQMSIQLALNKDLTSDFSGFTDEAAALSMNMTVKAGEEDIAMAVEQMNTFREVALGELKKESGEQQVAAAKIVDLLFDSYIDTVKSGKIDVAASLDLSDQSLTFLSAIKVSDGRQIEDSLKELVKLVEDKPDFPGIQWNAETHKGVAFHTMSIPTPPEEEIQKVFGESLAVVMGIGEQSVYMAFGEDAAGHLKTAIDQSIDGGSVAVDPAKFSIAVLPILQFLSGFEDDPKIAAAIAVMDGTADKIQISGSMQDDSGRTRISVQGGVIKAIAAAITGGDAEPVAQPEVEAAGF
ncbi:MAG: hypothetical protein ACKVH8_05485 [Pirellulales bacterium]